MVRRASRRAVLALALGAVLSPAPAAGQAGYAVAGTLVGAAEGAYLTLTLATAAARTGHYVFTPSQALWQLTPIPVMAVAGGVLGHRDADRFRDATRYGLVGFAAGVAVGSLVGGLFGEGSESVWSGAIVGGGAGLLVGNLWGALRGLGSDDGTAIPTLALTIPFGP